ncbi:ATP-binding cassette domain-containing protein [Aureimonas fodinaquatilis]|uniref:ATP-binding cassette domain-containing protein n=1 Tax=Aureimonas fodinaquatilis TaxID=2565783 RepID=A0A5B0DZC1_9HYPH|nr:ATP-binding cassette domain-containing protein [Aureimonas fodinaquatilis]KAA0971728.1 ATP-binding cassette domain-containing protein [Aureimonas fodinaquatilis]
MSQRRSSAKSPDARLKSPIAAFDLQSVEYAYAERRLIGPIDMQVFAGRVTGLIGHNGSGKSTLLKLLARQLLPTSGDIRFADAPLTACGPRAFARKVAYLPQITPPAHGMLVQELVALGRYPWHGALGRFGTTDHAKVAEALELTGTAQLSGRLVDTLSGGERQRVWLAMLVAQDASCLLLDEPISALDVAHQIEVMTLIRHLCDQRGLAVVVVLHDINMASRFCDEIIALHTGGIIASGPPSAIMTPEQLQSIYGISMAVLPGNGQRPLAFPL